MAGAAGLLARHLSNPAFGRIANLQLWLQSPGMGTGKALPRIGSAYGLQFSQGPIMVSAHSWQGLQRPLCRGIAKGLDRVCRGWLPRLIPWQCPGQSMPGDGSSHGMGSANAIPTISSNLWVYSLKDGANCLGLDGMECAIPLQGIGQRIPGNALDLQWIGQRQDRDLKILAHILQILGRSCKIPAGDLQPSLKPPQTSLFVV